MAEWLVADVGGTHTRIGLSTPDGLLGPSVATYRNASFTGLAPILSDYLAVHPARVTALCAGVAGPVRGHAAQLTNLDWFIDTQALGAATGAQGVHLLNDLQAQGFALDDLSPGALTPLRAGTADPNGTRLVLGLGTGSNIAVVHRVNGHLFVPPAETGHATLPYIAGLEGLWQHLAQSLAHLPMEGALSGPGLSRVHDWVSGQTLSPAEIIARHEAGDGAAGQTLQHIARIFGTVAGNLCLSQMATGGLYLIGGTARALAPHLGSLGYEEPFIAKGPYTDIMRGIPITLVNDDTAALRGCTRCLRQKMV